MKNLLLTLFIFISFCGNTFAQLTIVQGSDLNMTALQLVQTQLVGQGITVLDASFNGVLSGNISSNQIGKFIATNGAFQELKLGAGLILSTGNAAGAIGPNDTTSYSLQLALPGDPDLDAISGVTTHDAAVLEFSFIPVSDTIRFQYIFGSEEFIQYCSSINDAFGFFLSGPGITGTFSNQSDNIALMPDGVSYVTISNMCGDSIHSFWNNNGGINFQYNRIGYVFTAWHVVQPCQVYHIKIAVADAMDDMLDSGVFLEKNSFSATGFTVKTDYSVPGLGAKSVEGCSNATVTFKLSDITPVNDTIHYTLSGTATNGLDYPAIPATYVVIPAGHDSTFLTIAPFLDGSAEGTEYTVFSIPRINCSGTTTYVDSIYIYNNTPFQTSFTNDTVVCVGTTILLAANASGGQEPYSFLWNTGNMANGFSLAVPPGFQSYWIRAADACGINFSDTIDITGLIYSDILNNQVLYDLCSGSMLNIPIESSQPSIPNQWTATCNSPDITGYSGGSGPLILQNLNNNGYTPGTILYHIWAENAGCTGTTKDITVNLRPVNAVTFQMCNDPKTTTDAEPFTLRGGNPAGGTYSGAGVVSGIFHPGLAGAGIHQVSYTYTNTWGCTVVAQQPFTVVTLPAFNCGNILTDIRDNEQYSTVQIGNQCWMSRNLNHGNFISSGQMQRDNCIKEKYCLNDDPGNCILSGGLYQWDEMMQYMTTGGSHGFCPPGWHIPTDTDWNLLFSFYLNNAFAGSALKNTGFSGFEVLPTGARFNNMNWNYQGFASFLWSSVTHGPYKAWAHSMNTLDPSVSLYPANRSNALFVRCIQD